MADAVGAHDLQKLKVADLKALLKERGLPVIGNKADLVSRLMESGETAEAEVEELDENVLNEDDDVLGLDDLEKKSPEVKETEVIDKEPLKVSENGSKSDAESPTEKPKIVKIGDIDDSKRLSVRAQRFGAVSEDSKKASRAERFGTSQPQIKGAKEDNPISVVPTADFDKLKSRAERFGTAVSSVYGKVESVEKMKKRAERFGQVTSGTLAKVDTDERIQKRKERFGVTTAPAAATDEQTQKKLRTERFGSGK